jgi:serine/threonine protein kinase
MDLKLDNVVLTVFGTAKIIDFGLSVFAGTKIMGTRGTIDYIAPELLASSVCQELFYLVSHCQPSKPVCAHKSIDYFSFAVMFTEALTGGEKPFIDDDAVLVSSVDDSLKPVNLLKSFHCMTSSADYQPHESDSYEKG